MEGDPRPAAATTSGPESGPESRPESGPEAPPGGPVVIVGGGFAGLYTALALAQQRHHPPILLIEPQERFLFLPLLYELLSGELRRWEIAPRYDALLAGKGVAWLQDRVDRIDTAARQLLTRGGRRLGYSRLVIACGAEANHFGVPGADSHSAGFRSLEDVERLQQLVDVLKRERRPLQRLAVVGAGPTGVELACKLGDLLEGAAVVELIEQGPTLLPRSHAFCREQATQALRRRDVRLRTHTAVTAVEADRLRLALRGPEAGGSVEVLPVNGVLWTAGLGFRPPALHPAPPQDGLGRLRCGPDLRLEGHADVFAAGDLAHLPEAEEPLPCSAQVAFQQATLLAANLMHSLAGEPLEPFHWKDLGEMMSLGVGDACLTASGLTLAGPAAFQLRRIAYLTRLPGLSHSLRVAAGWLADWRP